MANGFFSGTINLLRSAEARTFDGEFRANALDPIEKMPDF